MPELPSNMQENLANLELGAGRVERVERSVSSGGASISSVDSYAVIQPASRQRLGQQAAARGGYTATYEHTNAGQYQNINNATSGQSGAYDGASYSSAPRSPRKKSIFPKPAHAGQNVPMSDDEKETILERARSTVINSNDPDMQLAWAQDALQWVEISMRDRERDDQASTEIPAVENQIRQDALEIVKFLSGQGHPKAEFMKGTWMEFGKWNHPLDKREAFLCYKRAANREVHGSSASGRAEYRMGWLFESTKEMPKAITHYQLGSEMGDSASSYRLGMMTLLGEHGHRKDPRRGLDLIRNAAGNADENAPQGAYMYGMLLAREISSIIVPEDILPTDIPMAKNYIEKAAYMGFSKAQMKMGQAYELCQLGCEFDPALSLHYNALAAKQGEAESDMAISKWFLCGHEGVFEKNEEQAFVFASRAAQTEMPTAEFALGYFYEIGIFVPADMAIAESWYKKAASHGNQDAISSLERISSKQYMSRDDHQKVGLTKIKSLHGSQRGGRPDSNRARRKPAPLAGLPEGAESNFSDRQPAHGPVASSGMGSPPIPPQGSRPPSAAPYPVDDRPPGRSQPPMPLHYRPNVGPSRSSDGRSWSGPQVDRPSSAVSVRPMQHTNTAPRNYANNARPIGQRAASAMGNMPVHPNGRGQASISQGYEQHRPSPNRAPAISQLNLGPKLGGGGYGRQSAGHPGYPDDSSARQGPYPTYLNSQNPKPQQQYPVRHTGFPNGGGTNSRPPRIPSVQPQSQIRNGSIPVEAQQQGPTRSQAPQADINSNFNRQAASQAPSQAAAPASVPASPPASPLPSISATAPAAAEAPAKTGPKTFEEMGFQVQKKDSECSMM